VPIDSDGFMKVVEAPTGFMRIRRAVLETTIARMPELQYRPDALHGYCHRFFDVMVDRETGRYLSTSTRSAAAGALWAERSSWMPGRSSRTMGRTPIAGISARRGRRIRRGRSAGNERTTRARSGRGRQPAARTRP